MNRAELATGKKVSPILLVGRIICGALMVVGAMAMATGNDFGAVLLVGAFIAMLITFLTSFF